MLAATILLLSTTMQRSVPASLVPGFSDAIKYVVMAGAVTGGGLTVIANSPNPAGQSILASRFGEAGISPLYLFLGALRHSNGRLNEHAQTQIRPIFKSG